MYIALVIFLMEYDIGRSGHQDKPPQKQVQFILLRGQFSVQNKNFLAALKIQYFFYYTWVKSRSRRPNTGRLSLSNLNSKTGEIIGANGKTTTDPT